MPASPARTADDIADNIRHVIDRVVDARVFDELAKRGADIGDFAGDAWKESRGFRRDAVKNAQRAADDASKWSDRTWRKSIRPALRDLWKQRTVAASAAAAAVPAGRELVDEAAVRIGLKQREERHWGAFFLGLLIGAAIGAVVALLATPKRGEEMRREIGARADDVRREVEQRTDEIATKAREEWVPMFQRPDNGSGTETPDVIEDAAATVQEGATDAGSTGVDAMEQTAEGTSETVSDVLEPADHDRPA
jgi:gas vesicle protein